MQHNWSYVGKACMIHLGFFRVYYLMRNTIMMTDTVTRNNNPRVLPTIAAIGTSLSAASSAAVHGVGVELPETRMNE